MNICVYQDQDPLGRGEWFSYTSFNGHVIKSFGGFPTREQAYEAAQISFIGGVL